VKKGHAHQSLQNSQRDAEKTCILRLDLNTCVEAAKRRIKFGDCTYTNKVMLFIRAQNMAINITRLLNIWAVQS